MMSNEKNPEKPPEVPVDEEVGRKRATGKAKVLAASPVLPEHKNAGRRRLPAGSTDEDAEVLRLFTTKRHKVVRSEARESAPRDGPVGKLRQGCPATPNVAPPGVQQVPHQLRHLRESEIAESVTPQDPRMQLAPVEPGEVISPLDRMAMIPMMFRSKP
ncbi:unnamed protein product [Cladocopium goreaui]|uniref:Uncharacterized protein n=1 Tax=Cladocopium goreaui TaxID=2562237 RepID=A0A9P1G8B3_9DINO|nr:unnamed protein product [Cladocopium goreaui]